MQKLQAWNAKFRESEKWPEEVGQEVIEKLLNLALDAHQLKQKGVVVINGVSATVESHSDFSWIKMGEVNDEKTWRIDVLFPAKVSIVKLNNGKLIPTGKVPVYDLPLKLTLDHQFSNWFDTKSKNHKVVIAAPIVDNILKSNNITGPKMYNYTLETTYKTHKGLIPRAVFVQIIPEDDVLSRMKKVSEHQWEMTCYDVLNVSGPFKFEKKVYSVVVVCSALTVLLIFILVHIMEFH